MWCDRMSGDNLPGCCTMIETSWPAGSRICSTCKALGCGVLNFTENEPPGDVSDLDAKFGLPGLNHRFATRRAQGAKLRGNRCFNVSAHSPAIRYLTDEIEETPADWLLYRQEPVIRRRARKWQALRMREVPPSFCKRR